MGNLMNIKISNNFIELDQGKLIKLLVEAFFNDPVERAIYPDNAEYLKFFPQVVKHYIKGCVEQKNVFYSEDYSVGLCAFKGKESVEEYDIYDFIRSTIPASRYERLISTQKYLDNIRDKYSNDLSLMMVGVKPYFRNLHFGVAILNKFIAQSKQRIYLEATSEKLIPFYKKFGFELIDVDYTGCDFPPTYPMIRQHQLPI